MGYQPLVLVAEDDEVNRELIKDILTSYDYRVIEAVTGKDAVEKARQEVPDLILMDIEMPVMNGLEAIRLIMDRPETNRVPIIVLTGLNETEDRIKAFDCGAMDFVAKPFNAHELVSHVRSYLRFSLLNKKYVLSTLDPDTQTPNRASFREKMPELDKPLLFMIKLDNMDAISHFYGEGTGREIEKNFIDFLSQLELLQHGVDDFLLYHLGKGLFGVVIENGKAKLDKEKAKQIGQHLLEHFETHQTYVKEVQYDLEATVAICFDEEKNLEKSELALNEAVRSSTGVMMVDEVIQDVYHTIGENIIWLKNIKDAVHEHRFLPFFQPILNGSSGKIEKYETLLRMVDEEGHFVAPGQFLFVAKNSKYYPDITKTVTLQAIDVFKDRSEEFSINLSALDIENHSTRDFLMDTLRRSPEIAGRIIFEIVEQEGIKHFEILKEFVKNAKQLGASIAIDDFGSGYSNFRMLLDMDVDYIKVDGSLIRNIHTDAISRSVVETIKTFAEKTSMKIIAEFVENQQIQDTLMEMGIHYFQGYHIGKPGLL